MGNDFQNLLFLFLALVLGAGAEELLPRVWGVGAPLLLTLALVVAPRLGLVTAGLVAVAAGAVEDAVSALAPLTSVSFFLLGAAVVRRTGVTRPVALLAYPCYQLWLSVWTPDLNVFTRALAALPAGVLTAEAFALVLAWMTDGKESAA